MDRVLLSQKRFSNSKHLYFSPRFSPPTELHEEYYQKINFKYSSSSSSSVITNQSTSPSFHYQNSQTSDNALSIIKSPSSPYTADYHFFTKISDISRRNLKNIKLFRKSLKNKLRKDISNYKSKLESLSNERDKISNCYVAIASLERMVKTETPSSGFREGIYGMLKALSADHDDNTNLTNQIISTMWEIIIKIWQDKRLGRCAICKHGVVMGSSIDNANDLWLCTNRSCISNKIGVISTSFLLKGSA
ncbi:578_t:CDS:1 [Dentiscutata erythropus]|uniref:578_t:CDS:1 n=1 Tax=Dentiscutata erythropus TaxID=1348616 RepID=A0A9N9F461_9GLOM|nr:578_t:CDS:1 [Dentiscutata erythropus]